MATFAMELEAADSTANSTKPFALEFEPGLLLAGVVGGPSTIFLYTPLRNAMTLGSQNKASTASMLYRATFQSNFFRGWTGALSPTMISSVQFVAMGPCYHMLFCPLFGPTLAVVPTALSESLISYGSQARNAQMVRNRTLPPVHQIKVQSPLNPIATGLPAHVVRNAVALSGIRVLSGPCQNATTYVLQSWGKDVSSPVAKNTIKCTSDFLASILAAVASMPFNQLFNFMATSPNMGELSLKEQLRESGAFLREQYVTQGRRLVVRDVFMRIAYMAPQLTTFAAIERLCRSWFSNDL